MHASMHACVYVCMPACEQVNMHASMKKTRTYYARDVVAQRVRYMYQHRFLCVCARVCVRV